MKSPAIMNNTTPMGSYSKNDYLFYSNSDVQTAWLNTLKNLIFIVACSTTATVVVLKLARAFGNA